MIFANQVAVITGASSGIGWALAKALAAGGCTLGLVARRPEKLQDLTEEIRQTGDSLFHRADSFHDLSTLLH